MSNIIAICGAKRSGKDVLAKYLVATRGFKKLSFAEPLKKAVRELFNFNDIQVGIDEDNAVGDEKEIIEEVEEIDGTTAASAPATEITLSAPQLEALAAVQKGFEEKKPVVLEETGGKNRSKKHRKNKKTYAD